MPGDKVIWMKDRENEAKGPSGEFGRRRERVTEEADYRRSPEVSVDGELEPRGPVARWVSSGMLFSYNLFFAMRADSQASPEYPLARVLSTEAGIVLGLLMALTLLLVLHDRRRVSWLAGTGEKVSASGTQGITVN